MCAHINDSIVLCHNLGSEFSKIFHSSLQRAQVNTTVKGMSVIINMPCCHDCSCFALCTELYRYTYNNSASFSYTPHEKKKNKGRSEFGFYSEREKCIYSECKYM